MPDQIYIADNSSTQYVKDYASRYHWSVPMVVDPNPGSIYASWNAGMDYAQGDVLIINDDLIISENFIRDLKGHSPAVISCPLVPGFPVTNRVRPNFHWSISNSGEGGTFIKEASNTYTPQLRGWCMHIPLYVQKRLGKFDEQFDIWYGDKDYEMRLFKEQMWIKLIDTPVSHYGTSSFSKIPKNTYNQINYSDQVKFEKKYGIPHKDLGWDKYATSFV